MIGAKGEKSKKVGGTITKLRFLNLNDPGGDGRDECKKFRKERHLEHQDSKRNVWKEFRDTRFYI